jgi:hypothetical protein
MLNRFRERGHLSFVVLLEGKTFSILLLNMILACGCHSSGNILKIIAVKKPIFKVYITYLLLAILL